MTYSFWSDKLERAWGISEELIENIQRGLVMRGTQSRGLTAFFVAVHVGNRYWSLPLDWYCCNGSSLINLGIGSLLILKKKNMVLWTDRGSSFWKAVSNYEIIFSYICINFNFEIKPMWHIFSWLWLEKI